VAYRRRDFAHARELFERSISLVHERADDWSLAMRLLDLAYVTLAQRNRRQARSLFIESQEVWRSLGQVRGAVLCLAGLASFRAAERRFLESARLLAASEAACARESVALEPTARLAYEADVLSMKQRTSAREFTQAWSVGSRLALDDALTEAVDAGSAVVSNGGPKDRLTERA
jgi:hypothetical protein